MFARVVGRNSCGPENCQYEISSSIIYNTENGSYHTAEKVFIVAKFLI